MLIPKMASVWPYLVGSLRFTSAGAEASVLPPCMDLFPYSGWGNTPGIEHGDAPLHHPTVFLAGRKRDISVQIVSLCSA